MFDYFFELYKVFLFVKLHIYKFCYFVKFLLLYNHNALEKPLNKQLYSAKSQLNMKFRNLFSSKQTYKIVIKFQLHLMQFNPYTICQHALT